MASLSTSQILLNGQQGTTHVRQLGELGEVRDLARQIVAMQVTHMVRFTHKLPLKTLDSSLTSLSTVNIIINGQQRSYSRFSWVSWARSGISPVRLLESRHLPQPGGERFCRPTGQLPGRPTCHVPLHFHL